MEINHNTHNLQDRVSYALARLAESKPELASRMTWGNVTVRMSTRLRRAIGRCQYWRVKDVVVIEFSSDMFDRLPELDKTDTVIHELAHAIGFRLNIDRGHGAGFKMLCRAMGGSGERLMQTETPTKKNKIKRYVLTHKINTPEYNIRILTKKDAQFVLEAFPHDNKWIGTIQIDLNTKTYKWVYVKSEAIREIEILKADKGWRMVA